MYKWHAINSQVAAKVPEKPDPSSLYNKPIWDITEAGMDAEWLLERLELALRGNAQEGIPILISRLRVRLSELAQTALATMRKEGAETDTVERDLRAFNSRIDDFWESASKATSDEKRMIRLWSIYQEFDTMIHSYFLGAFYAAIPHSENGFWKNLATELGHRASLIVQLPRREVPGIRVRKKRGEGEEEEEVEEK